MRRLKNLALMALVAVLSTIPVLGVGADEALESTTEEMFT